MSTLLIDGKRVVSGSVSIARVGAMVADVVLGQSDEISTSCVVKVGDLELAGTVFRMAPFSGSRSARVVGGAAGWRKVLPKRGYSHDAGILASTVLQDAAREAGETIVVDADRTIGTSWARREGKAEATIRLLTGGEWWVDPAGVTQTKARDASPIGTPFTVVGQSGAKGHFEIATEFYADWQPGRTFSAPTIDGVRTVSLVRYDAGNDGKLRLIVLSTESERDRMLADIRNIIRSELAALTYAAVWDYTVAPSLGLGLSSTLDLVSSDPSMPDLTNVPLAPGLLEAAPSSGTTCRVRFVNSDPGRPEVISLGAATEHLMTAEATSLLIYNVLVAIMTAAGGGPLLALTLQPLIMPAILAALAAQAAPAPPGKIPQTILATSLAAAMATGTTPSPTSMPFNAAIAALATKTLDVSGFFPSVGVPYG